MKRVAFVIAVELAPHEHSQIAFADRLRAFYAERSGAGRPAIYQYEPHVAPPGAKQYTVSVELLTLGGGAHRWFLPSGLSLFHSTF